MPKVEAKDMVCIVCPVGCRLKAQRIGEDVTVEGYSCKRGLQYAKQEFLCPMRTVTSSVRTLHGERLVCAVKTAGQVPKERIPQVLEAIRALRVEAPIRQGQVLIEDTADTGVRLVATASVNA
ncbi:MAG: DUF1667 domain-containing protein [Clostridia bacterium]